MATAPSLLHVPVEEYLASSYSPDREYVEGVLVDRSIPTIPHGVLQMTLIQHFGRDQQALGFLPVPEFARRSSRARHRVPDLILCGLPVPPGAIVTTSPGR